MRSILLTAGLLAAAPALAETLALQCGDVFDSKSARLSGAHTIVTSDGRIGQVLPGRVAVPGARAVDLAGHTCMPGWIDLHVHLASESNPRATKSDSVSTTSTSPAARWATPRRRCGRLHDRA